MENQDRLERFVAAQRTAYDRALSEIKGGRKASHWMWFVFPQLRGLGRTETARFYGLSGIEEAAAYLRHPVLGTRLVEISRALMQQAERDALVVFGKPDNRKLRSCMTLFSKVDGADPVFGQVLDAFFEGEGDPLTLELLRKDGDESHKTTNT